MVQKVVGYASVLSVFLQRNRVESTDFLLCLFLRNFNKSSYQIQTTLVVQVVFNTFLGLIQHLDPMIYPEQRKLAAAE